MSKYLRVADTVKIITGKDKGKTGKITEFDRKHNQIKIDGVNLKTCFNKESRSGITKVPGWINASNVMYLEGEHTTRLFRKDGKRYSRKTLKEISE